MGKNKKSFAWLWIVLALTAAGLSYLRVRSLMNQGKAGKDLVLDFIPGVGDLVYAYAGTSKNNAPIAADAQHGYSYNPAAGKKEIKMLEEEAEKPVFKPAHEPIKRPKELSVNHAAVAAAAAAGTTEKTAEKAENPFKLEPRPKAASPFKPVEGLERAEKVDPNKVFKTEVSHTTDEIMTSAFKPTAGSHPNEKIVTSAFKPSAGTHPSDKIVTSAVKPTSKFTPQGKVAAPSNATSEAAKQARERAEAAREQQAMRAAMRTGRSVAEIKGEAPKKVQQVPYKRSAFSSNPAAPSASAIAKAEPKSVQEISAVHAKGSGNSNQLGNMLAGKSHNNSGRAPVWAAPGTAGINPFKQTAEAQEEAVNEAENQASKAEAPARQSYADQATSHKSAYFSRSSASKEAQAEEPELTPGAYGIVRPAANVEGQHIRDTRYKQAKGQVLEGQRPAIMDPSTQVAPTAVQPVLGFKPINPQ